jgi:anti-anti-sigma regulatory factor
MRWPRGRGKAVSARPPVDPVIVSVTSPLNRQTALELARRLDRLEPTAPVVIDLTGIPSFDTDGAEAVLHLQESAVGRQVSIVGFRQATDRLVGATLVEQATPAPPDGGWVQRQLRNLVVVQPVDDTTAHVNGLDAAIAAAAGTDSAIIVVDLRGVPALDRAAVETIAFASSAAAVRGQEMLVVNVAEVTADALRAAGLSATTYVAPQPPA